MRKLHITYWPAWMDLRAARWTVRAEGGRIPRESGRGRTSGVGGIDGNYRVITLFHCDNGNLPLR